LAYLDDTNYQKMMQPFSSLFAGSNQGELTLILSSAGAKDFTVFMQAVSHSPAN
jgi:hypothetical protein